MSARSSPSRRVRSAELRASPHSSRCLPICHRSPGRVVIGPSRPSTSISSAGSREGSSKSVLKRSISAGSKPVIDSSRLSSARSSGSSASSAASRSRSQPASWAIRLSASISALFLASLRPLMTMAGTVGRARDFAASRRACPAMSMPCSSTITGATKPNASTLAAIFLICFLLWVRQFLGFVLIRLMGMTTRVGCMTCPSPESARTRALPASLR